MTDTNNNMDWEPDRRDYPRLSSPLEKITGYLPLMVVGILVLIAIAALFWV